MTTCSALSLTRKEPLAGTAAVARTWVVFEQPGPWGRQALTDGRLDPAVGARLESWTALGVRAALIRSPGRPADRGMNGTRRAFLAHTLPGRARVVAAALDADEGPEHLAGLDPEALAAGDFAAAGARGPAEGGPWEAYRGDPLVLVCTNGRRDRCCAVLGRPLAAEAASAGGAAVWEVTHLGGHRFSPTLLVLPHGYAYGRMTGPAVKAVVEAVRAGLVVTEGCRGRSAWEPAGQAAELAVRGTTGERDVDALEVIPPEPGEPPAGPSGEPADRWVRVRRRDGTAAWRVRVERDSTVPPFPASCGARALPQARVLATAVEPLPRTG
ncbi:sucrase ferredoxin [Streptomyces sp. IF17]|nr:sucrase ferredoxin [Streptomyces alkaliphilus]